jgi:hypothetical protein
MFYTILNQPYLSLDQYIDTKKFDLIIDDIITGIAKSANLASPTHPGSGYVDKEKKSIVEIYESIMGDTQHPYHDLINELGRQHSLIFIQYKWPSHIMGRSIVLRQFSKYLLKHSASECKDTPAIKNFTSFMEWLKEENIFEEIGRTIIFLNDSFSFPIEHKDYDDIIRINRKDQFIWINPLCNKKFYIKEGSKKIYFESKFCYFDNRNLHGGDPSNYSTFSMKVDGIFSKSFLDKTGLTSHLLD